MAIEGVGILWGGGDVCGLNSAIKSAVRRGNALDIKMEGPGAGRCGL